MASKKKNKKLQKMAETAENINITEEIDTEFIPEPEAEEFDAATEVIDRSAEENLEPVVEEQDSKIVEDISEEPSPEPEKAVDTLAAPYLVKLVVVLTCICAGIALLLAVVNSVTKNVIIENQAKAKQEAILAVFPEGDAVEEYTAASGETVYIVLKDNEIVGYTVNAIASGYMGPVEMMVGMTSEGAVDGIKIISMSDTPGVGTKISAESFLSLFYGFDRPVKLGEDVDGISGATFSSRAVEEAVNYAVSLEVDLADAAARIGAGFADGSGNADETDANEDNGDGQIEIGEAVEESDETVPETAPAESESTETEPVETEPAAETEPVETEPVETAPIETEPAETETEVPVAAEPEIAVESETETEEETWWPVVEPETTPVETEPVVETETTPVETETQPVMETEPAVETETTPVETEPVAETESDTMPAPETASEESDAAEIETAPVDPTETPESAEEPETEPAETYETIEETVPQTESIEPETEPETVPETVPETEPEESETKKETTQSNKGSFIW